jgi:hypothetical protein
VVWPFPKQKPATEILEITNNTLVGNGEMLGFARAAPTQGFIARNNIFSIGLHFEAVQKVADNGVRNKDWQLDHNCYFRRASFSEAPSDVLDEPPFLSVDPSQPNYARIAVEGPAAKGGAGGTWPSYIGAFPPGPAPKEGDWFTRLRSRWPPAGK